MVVIILLNIYKGEIIMSLEGYITVENWCEKNKISEKAAMALIRKKQIQVSKFDNVRIVVEADMNREFEVEIKRQITSREARKKAKGEQAKSVREAVMLATTIRKIKKEAGSLDGVNELFDGLAQSISDGSLAETLEAKKKLAIESIDTLQTVKEKLPNGHRAKGSSSEGASTSQSQTGTGSPTTQAVSNPLNSFPQSITATAPGSVAAGTFPPPPPNPSGSGSQPTGGGAV